MPVGSVAGSEVNLTFCDLLAPALIVKFRGLDATKISLPSKVDVVSA